MSTTSSPTDSSTTLSTPPADATGVGSRRSISLGLGLLGVALAIVGSFSTWTVAGPISLSGVEGPNNGWLCVFFALFGLTCVSSASRGSRIGGIGCLLMALAVLSTAVQDAFATPEMLDGRIGWGVIAVAVGGTLLAVAGGLGIAWARPDRRRRGRLAGVFAIVGLVVAVIFFVAWRQVLYLDQEPHWPPPADAVTAAQAQAATEEFAAREDPRPDEVAIDYAESTAATIDPYVEGVEFYPRIFDDIEQAQDSIHVLMFGWREGEIGMEMARRLVRKLEEGVEVRILVDTFGSRPYGEANQMYTMLKDAGAEIVVNDVLPIDDDGTFPKRRFDWRQDEVGRADHRKLYVIDGTAAWTGGAGIEDHFVDGGFHDVMVRVTGDIVRQAQAVFLTSFRSHAAPLPDELSPYFPEQPDPGTIPAWVLQVVPGGFHTGAEALRVQIDNARERIDVTNPYLTDPDMISRLIEAARRGVDVRIIVSEKSNNPFASAALKHRYKTMLDAGIEVLEYPGAVVHGKVLVADDVVHFGTVNLDAWALYRNYEIAIEAHSPEAAALFKQRLFDPDAAKSKPGTPPEGVGDRLYSWLWDKLTYFL